MRYSEFWQDYELIEAAGGERLERWGDIILIRPDPQAIFAAPRTDKRWNSAHARYIRSKKGGGHWETYKHVPDVWTIGYRGLKFNLKPMGFKHTGLFPEQAVNWDLMSDIVKRSDRQLKVLNLFGYTGAASLMLAKSGAAVTHVDASKGMVLWGKDNAAASGLADKPIRWLVDDCIKFVEREIRRGNKYDGIVMDPPSYGRGPNGEVWQLEEKIYPLVELCCKILSDDARFFLINSYTAGISPSVMQYILGLTVQNRFGGSLSCDEIGLKVSSTGLVLPCGSTAVWLGR